MPDFTTPMHEANDCHTPAGSPAGGQFCSKGTGGHLGPAIRRNPDLSWQGRTLTPKERVTSQTRRALDVAAQRGDTFAQAMLAKLLAKQVTPAVRPYSSFEEFAAHARENLQRTSRTAKGKSDTSDAGPDKPKLAATEGQGLASRTEVNFTQTLKRVWDAAHTPMALTPDSVLSFVHEIGGRVNAGLLQSGQSPLRTWATKYPSTAPTDIPTALSDFARELSARLRVEQVSGGGSNVADPIATAAWVEKTFENIHPLADGVGRATKALSAFVLLRAGQRLPTYRDRDSYYANIGTDKSFESWLTYYRSLF